MFQSFFTYHKQTTADLSRYERHIQTKKHVSSIAPAAVAFSYLLLFNHTRHGEHNVLWIKLSSFGRYAYHLLHLRYNLIRLAVVLLVMNSAGSRGGINNRKTKPTKRGANHSPI